MHISLSLPGTGVVHLAPIILFHLGPLISRGATERAEDIIQQSIDEGATCMLDGRSVKVEGYEDGNFLGPTVINLSHEQYTDLNSSLISNPAYTEEIFAPVLTILAVPTLDDAIKISNKNAYGNGTAIFTTSGGAARKYQYEIEAGQVGINVPLPVPLPFFSFSGNKASIRGDVNFYGKVSKQWSVISVGIHLQLIRFWYAAHTSSLEYISLPS